MKPRVYIEISVVSYLAASPSRDLIVAAHQEVTRAWCGVAAVEFDLVTSIVTIEEATRGATNMAEARLQILDGMTEFPVTVRATALASEFVDAGALPPKAYQDALHVAVAAEQGVAFLVSWNCKHIANARMIGKMQQICAAAGFSAPRICTPLELWEN